ncbi:MAG: MOSC domain-containing protein [Myxococcales bacterium]|nr:MAG: MOSC domain-containing protein [Myxococcales bacterium]
MKPLYERLRDVPQVGRVTWLGLRPEHGAAIVPLEEVELVTGRGAQGDIAARSKAGHGRQVTLLQEEHLPVLAGLTGAIEVRPEQLRRNVLVAGINLLALVKLRFAVGEAVLEGSGHCAPCAKMDALLGPGGFQAVRGHGGITARVLSGAVVRIGDPVRVLNDD